MKKLLLLTTAAMAFAFSSNAQVVGADTYLLGDSNWTIMTAFPQIGTNEYTVYYNGTSPVGELKGPFNWNTNPTKYNDLYFGGVGNQQAGGFNYTNGKASVKNALNSATINYDTKEVTVGAADNISIEVNEILPFVSPLDLYVPVGISVFEYNSYEDGVLNVVASSSNIISANKPVILKSIANKSYTFEFAQENSNLNFDTETVNNKQVLILDSNDGILYGVQMAHYIPANAYVFDGNSFTLQENNTTDILLPLNSYLQLSEEDVTDGYPESITIEFPEEEESAITVNLGSDTTNQSGTVSDNSITITTVGTGALVYVEVSDDIESIYYYIAPSDDEDDEVKEDGPEDLPSGPSSVRRRALPADASYTAAKVKDGVATIPLEVGSGQLYIATSSEGENEQVFTYTVTNGIPTAVEAVEAAGGESGAIYNIFGQKVAENYKGIVIKNGKKFVQR